VYARRIGEWWDPAYTASPPTFAGVTIEPRVGGRIYAAFSDRHDDDWGTVRVWEPPHRLVHTFTLAQRADTPSEVGVRFSPSGSGSVVRFEHGGWNDANAGYRVKFSDWRLILDRYASLVRRQNR
jgi:uncharacterized protein YndB with AHSA1/START domain